MRQCAPKILETNSKSIFQSSTIVNNTWTCPQFHILKPAHFVQPQLSSCTYIILWLHQFVQLLHQGKHQGSQLACLLEDSRQCRFRPWHTCPLRTTKKGSSDHFLFHRKTITNLKVAVNLLHLASLNCFDHFRNDFSCYRGIFSRRCSRFKPFNPRG